MIKSKIRKKILRIRSNNNNTYNKINFKKIYKLLNKNNDLRKKVVGGYYPVNKEIDDLNILRKLEKKKIKISLPSIKKDFKMNFIECKLLNPQ